MNQATLSLGVCSLPSAVAPDETATNYAARPSLSQINSLIPTLPRPNLTPGYDRFKGVYVSPYVAASSSRVWGPSGDGPKPTLYIKDKDLAPEFDYDFTNVTDDDGQPFQRGGYEYKRPCGWDRCALAVVGKYYSDVWLGPDGIRHDSAPGEWAVSYHGTAVSNIGSIADGGYDLGKGKRHAYGPGIYSSPSIHVAEEDQYAKTFSHQGKQYKVVMQNRVNLAGTVVEKVNGGKVYFITKESHDIRPYGVCLREVK